MKKHSLAVAVLGVALVAAAAAYAAGGDDMKMHGMGDASKQAAPAVTEKGHSHEACQIHGGSAVASKDGHFEVLFTPAEARVYIYKEDHKPVSSLEGMKAMMMLSPKDMVSMERVKADPKKGFAQDYFVVRRDFSKVDGGAKAMFHVEGLSKAAIMFESPLTLGKQAAYTCSMCPSVKAEEPGRCPMCGMNLQRS